MKTIIPKIGNDWDDLLIKEFKKDQMQQLLNRIEYSTDVIFPPKEDIFNALKTTSYADTRVVILGQDPYIKEGQAHGYSFSVKPGVQVPPSLMNIFQELHDDIGCYIPNNGCLIPWAKQGVLLLNSILTVKEGQSRSFANMGWEKFTDHIIWLLNKKDTGIVFMLWGNYARSKASLIDPNSHLILQAAHPSPLAGGAFFGCKHFSKANNFLYEIYPSTIDWQIPNV